MPGQRPDQSSALSLLPKQNINLQILSPCLLLAGKRKRFYARSKALTNRQRYLFRLNRILNFRFCPLPPIGWRKGSPFMPSQRPDQSSALSLLPKQNIKLQILSPRLLLAGNISASTPGRRPDQSSASSLLPKQNIKLQILSPRLLLAGEKVALVCQVKGLTNHQRISSA